MTRNILSTMKPVKSMNSSLAIKNISEVLDALGFDLTEEGHKDTPKRVFKYWQSMLEDEEPINFTCFDSHGVDEMVIKTNIPFASACEHHLLPFYGVAHVAYIPNGKILGLSKIPRLIKGKAKKFTTQEYLTAEIANKLSSVVGSRNVMIILSAEHTCESCRGVFSTGQTTTSAILGAFKDNPAAREEALQIIRS